MAQTAQLLNLPHQPTDKAVSIDTHDNTPSSQTPILPIKDISYHTITTQQDFTKLLDKLNHTPYFAIDTETTDINWQHAKLVGISVSTADYEGYYIPVGHTEDFDILLDNQLPIDTVLSAFKPILENPNIGKIGQHLKYDAHIFKKYGINISPWQMDTMLASYVINAAATRHGMDALAKHYLGVQTTTFEDVAGKGAKQLSFDKVAMDAASQYACEDADITFRLFNRFNQHINQDKTAAQLLYRLEIPTAQILTQMEHDGILIDTDFLGQLSDEFE
ncbi:DNA polymerase I [Moraxella catarrhalis]|nr:DNA polymerase I [Moraxella catarrhalis]